jgi:hypothetical protein
LDFRHDRELSTGIRPVDFLLCVRQRCVLVVAAATGAGRCGLTAVTLALPLALDTPDR